MAAQNIVEATGNQFRISAYIFSAFRAFHTLRWREQWAVAAMGRMSVSRIGSRPFVVLGKNNRSF
jgi:hypothetical protein